MANPIVLVEDDPRDIELTQFALRKARLDNEVVLLRDGAEALDYLFHRGKFVDAPVARPAVILLDLKLPKVNGLQVLEQLKRESVTSDIPVVMLTASREQSDLTRSCDLGVNAYIVKPIGFQEFVRAIQELGTFWGTRSKAHTSVAQL